MSDTVNSVLADPLHPYHDEVANTVIGLQSGELSMCACLGAMFGEPHCPCTMDRLGLPASAERLASDAAATQKWKALVDSGIFAPGN